MAIFPAKSCKITHNFFLTNMGFPNWGEGDPRLGKNSHIFPRFFFGRRPLDPMIARPKNMGVEASGIGTCLVARIYAHQMDDHVDFFKVTDITIGTQIKDVFQA